MLLNDQPSIVTLFQSQARWQHSKRSFMST